MGGRSVRIGAGAARLRSPLGHFARSFLDRRRPGFEGSGTAGFTLFELLAVLSLVGLFATIGLPALFRTTARLRVEMAARETAAVLRLAQLYAIRHDANVAVRFQTAASGRVAFRLYRDGDGDGVLNRDIDSGVDPAVAPARLVRHLGADIGFSLPQREPPLHPSSGRPLRNLEDPIRFNRSDLASFAAGGTATPGTLYLSNRNDQLVAVRVVSRTGRVRIQRYDYGSRTWSEI